MEDNIFSSMISLEFSYKSMNKAYKSLKSLSFSSYFKSFFSFYGLLILYLSAFFNSRTTNYSRQSNMCYTITSYFIIIICVVCGCSLIFTKNFMDNSTDFTRIVVFSLSVFLSETIKCYIEILSQKDETLHIKSFNLIIIISNLLWVFLSIIEFKELLLVNFVFMFLMWVVVICKGFYYSYIEIILIFNLHTLFTIFIAYLITFSFKKCFFLRKMNEEIKAHKDDLLDQMNPGYVHLKNNELFYVNKSHLDRIHFLLRDEMFLRDSGIGDKFLKAGIKNTDIPKEFDFFKENTFSVLWYFFQNLNLHYLQEFEYPHKELLGSPGTINLDFLKAFVKYRQARENAYNKFIILGHKECRYLSLAFEINCRFYINTQDKSQNLEFIFNNISKVNGEKSSELKSQALILSKIAHEFKNPLICISEIAEQVREAALMLKDKEKSKREFIYSKLNNNLPNIKALSQYLLILIKDMDHYAQTQLNKTIKAEISNAKISETVRFCEEIAVCLLTKNNKSDKVTFKVIKEDFVPEVIKTDEYKLRQILINLISNSVKFTHKGEISLEIRKYEDKLKFIVNDTGIGISDDLKKQLFKPYIKNIDEMNKVGSGLGLNVVKDLTTLLGAEIKFDSTYGEGSKFWFEIKIEEGTHFYENPLETLEDIEHRTIDDMIKKRVKKRNSPDSVRSGNSILINCPINFYEKRPTIKKNSSKSNLSRFAKKRIESSEEGGGSDSCGSLKSRETVKIDDFVMGNLDKNANLNRNMKKTPFSKKAYN